MWGLQKEQAYVITCRTVEDLLTRFQAAVTKVDAKVLRRVPEISCSALMSALKWTAAASSSYNREALVVWSI